VDIAHLGGFTYVQSRKAPREAARAARTRPEFPQPVRHAAGSPIQSLSDLKGRSFAFATELHSGHLMPEYFMRENKSTRK